MIDTPPNALWANHLIDALATAGVRHVCISPGARSSPLTLAVARRDDLTTSVHIDERSAAFFALGYGRATGRPAVLICTSGTAAANYLPAVIEAHYGRVPLIVLTADRPPELRDTGAWQAIDQIKLFGPYTRWFAEVATPSDSPQLLRYVRNIAGRAVAQACGRPPGPVHLNLPFREPLVASNDGDLGAPDGQAVGGDIQIAGVVAMPLPETVDALAARIAAAPHGLILAGGHAAPAGYADAVARLAAASGYPVMAEPTSGLRFGPHDQSLIVTGYDAFLRSDTWSETAQPDLVLRFGASFTWRYVAQFLERHPGAAQIVIDPDGTWDDPTRLASLRIPADPRPLCDALVAQLAGDNLSKESERDTWRSHWRHASDIATSTRESMAHAAENDTIPWVYAALIDALSDGDLLFAANSMAVRDLDTFTGTSTAAVRVLANRGAAGIDGTVSTALGAAFGSASPTVLVTGDLAFLHDLNGLGAAHLEPIGATVLVLNDGGGGIFDYQPVAEQAPEAFERFFLTPPHADLAAACATYGVAHQVVGDPPALRAALAASLRAPGVQVIEIPLDRVANTAAHRRFWAAVAAAL